MELRPIRPRSLGICLRKSTWCLRYLGPLECAAIRSNTWWFVTADAVDNALGTFMAHHHRMRKLAYQR